LSLPRASLSRRPRDFGDAETADGNAVRMSHPHLADAARHHGGKCCRGIGSGEMLSGRRRFKNEQNRPGIAHAAACVTPVRASLKKFCNSACRAARRCFRMELHAGGGASDCARQ